MMVRWGLVRWNYTVLATPAGRGAFDVVRGWVDGRMDGGRGGEKHAQRVVFVGSGQPEGFAAAALTLVARSCQLVLVVASNHGARGALRARSGTWRSNTSTPRT